MNKIVLISILFIYLSSVSLGQSKKKIVKAGIKTKIEWKYIVSSGEEKKIKKKVVKYNNRGKVTEEIQYEDNGNIEKRKTKRYNENGDIIEKISYLPTGKIKKKTVYEYKNGFKRLKLEYNGKGKLISKKEYEYIKW